MKTTSHITIIAALIALLVPATASANVYKDRLKEAFVNIINAVPLEDLSQMHTTYTDPETGVKEGQLDVYKFTLGRESGTGLINAAKDIYEQLGDDMENNLPLRGEVYTLWWTNHDDTFQGYRLYYDPESTIIVGLACDYCYTVGLISPDNVKHRTTYTIEWDDATPGVVDANCWGSVSTAGGVAGTVSLSTWAVTAGCSGRVVDDGWCRSTAGTTMAAVMQAAAAMPHQRRPIWAMNGAGLGSSSAGRLPSSMPLSI